jgi:drug/metabolite transporter (DMT)-like permease
LGIICTVIPTLCLAQAIYLIGSSNTALIGGVGPVSTIVLASVFLGESLLAVQIVGVALVIVGVGSLQFVRQ